MQIRTHILRHCPRHAAHRDLLKEDGAIDMGKLLGTPDGLYRLAAFLEASTAYEIHNDPEE